MKLIFICYLLISIFFG